MPSPPLESLTLLTDLYQLTMACGYWKCGLHEHEAVFHLTFREHPFRGGYTIACGLAAAIDYLQSLRFSASDLEYLRTLPDAYGEPLFPDEFLTYLSRSHFACDVDATPEGTVVFPHEPLVRVRGPLWQCQLVETTLLNLINFQTLIATKSARVCQAARGKQVLEFGLRRAQGPDGGLSASRAAYVGGCHATSNVLAGKQYGIPVRGTHAHSWVMSFRDEITAFAAYAEAMPGNCVLLVDTYDTREGVRRAAEIGRLMAQEGKTLLGVRLDSGDLGQLSIDARKILDDAGLKQSQIVASGDLDEYLINDLIERGAQIDIYGVGTKLATAHEQPALGGVYKLGAIRRRPGPWEYKVKRSEQLIKVSNPGVQQVRRFTHSGRAVGDVIYNTEAAPTAHWEFVQQQDPGHAPQAVDPAAAGYDLLEPIFRGGSLCYDRPPIDDLRQRTLSQLALFDDRVKRLKQADVYPVGLERGLFELKKDLLR